MLRRLLLVVVTLLTYCHNFSSQAGYLELFASEMNDSNNDCRISFITVATL